MRLAIALAAATLLLPASASAKFVNLSCMSDGAQSALLMQIDTDAKVIQIASSTEKLWHFLTSVGVTDTDFTGSVPLQTGGTRQFEVDRGGGTLVVTQPDGSRISASCSVTTFQNQF